MQYLCCILKICCIFGYSINDYVISVIAIEPEKLKFDGKFTVNTNYLQCGRLLYYYRRFLRSW